MRTARMLHCKTQPHAHRTVVQVPLCGKPRTWLPFHPLLQHKGRLEILFRSVALGLVPEGADSGVYRWLLVFGLLATWLDFERH